MFVASIRAALSWLVPITLGIGAESAAAGSLAAQVGQEHHDSTGHTAPAPADTRMLGMPERPFGIPMTRMGSGTAWLPDASAMRAWHCDGRLVDTDGPRRRLPAIRPPGRAARRRPGRQHQLGHADGDAAGGRRYAPSPRHGECRAPDHRRPRLSLAAAERRDLRWRAAARPAASPRPLHGAVGALRAADQPPPRCHGVCRAGRRARDRSRGLHAPALGPE